MVDNYWSRLKPEMDAKGLDKSQLASALKVTYQAIDKLDKKGGSLGSKNNILAAKLLGLNPEWLATGKGAKQASGVVSLAEAIPMSAGKMKPIWVVGRGSGGQMPERVWTDADHPVGVTDQFAEEASADPHAFLIEVVGPSMVPRYNPGEFALVEPGTEPEVEDDVLVRLADGQTLLKQLLSKRGGFRLGSYNNGHEVLFYKPEEVTWMYYVAHPVPRRRIKSRN